MIHTIEIENFRGIRTGRLEGLAPLTILTGPNASGKSAVLDALLVGASPDPADAVGRAVARHPVSISGARWLFWRLGSACRLMLVLESGSTAERHLRWTERVSSKLEDRLYARRSIPPFSMIEVFEGGPEEKRILGRTGIDSDNGYVTDRSEEESIEQQVSMLRLIDPGLPIPLHRTYSAVSRSGRLDEVTKLLRSIIGDFEQLEILVDDRDRPVLYAKGTGGSSPLPLSGDGVQSFVQLALELTMLEDGIALIEEPEVYQHPKALWQTAKVILANVRRGVQVVMTTHSLELIDALISEATEEDLDRMVTFNLALEDGDLQTERWTGDDFAFARREVGTDLR